MGSHDKICVVRAVQVVSSSHSFQEINQSGSRESQVKNVAFMFRFPCRSVRVHIRTCKQYSSSRHIQYTFRIHVHSLVFHGQMHLATLSGRRAGQPTMASPKFTGGRPPHTVLGLACFLPRAPHSLPFQRHSWCQKREFHVDQARYIQRH